ncbi:MULTISPECIES: helix-turn-helix transcriptional regulator [unclassified Salinivibrio]|jgi:Predicted transcriptional regulators|uniref:helix-turn-helix transcriptional regulator n=1 Tax=unclassified Salinivibrio TaxID=2636825 RepID=UPI00092BB4B7|nr:MULTISPECIES: helix-turn-helix transcriptional regulator [unclassified Salinivibrio]SIO31377.1 DNA-binding transcriptional regulator, XRE-family HTH domain [Salinivibrio sp. ES.052]SIO31446.1 DNA-binding transcriptional regulator, XRE-family HTH domain [Salinivibrio sp. ES.052]SIO39251.1 DNA-binding transcriptional regulator, XRE-family HTH domain [Salinivibrio sp. ES.052]SIO39320.1 DNA-binding transcriptional regulator, XRE-family HTH domain [Salinivibrio sp. ES.052]SIO39394.1 DNA-binding 
MKEIYTYGRYDMLKDVLKEARSRAGLKQSEIAKKMGITPQTYLKWENGKTEPKASQVHELAKILNISEREICSGKAIKRSKTPMEFLYKASHAMNKVNDTILMITLWDYIDDEEEFINKLWEAVDTKRHYLGEAEGQSPDVRT